MSPKKAANEAPELKSIHAAINWIMSQVGYVQKKKSGGLNYSFAGEAALIQALRPYLVEAGVTMSVVGVSNKLREKYETKSGTAMNSTVVDLVVRFYHAPSDTFLDVCSSGEGADSGDKSSNKALTGAYKYALRQTFCIETGDDPDLEPSSKQERKPGTQTSATRPTTTSTPASATSQPPAPVVVTETLEQAKARLTEELTKEFAAKYPDRAAIGAAMKSMTPALAFTDPAQFSNIKAQLVMLATA